jgi:hypothetical protein
MLVRRAQWNIKSNPADIADIAITSFFLLDFLGQCYSPSPSPCLSCMPKRYLERIHISMNRMIDCCRDDFQSVTISQDMFSNVMIELPKTLQLECDGQLLKKLSMHMPLDTIDKIRTRVECRLLQ